MVMLPAIKQYFAVVLAFQCSILIAQQGMGHGRVVLTVSALFITKSHPKTVKGAKIRTARGQDALVRWNSCYSTPLQYRTIQTNVQTSKVTAEITELTVSHTTLLF
jgi:hypothetical protein